VSIVLGIVLPVFAIIALGYAASRWRFVDDGGFRGLNFFTFSIASPCLLFNGGTSGHEGGGPAAFAFFIASMLIYGIALWLGRARLRQGIGAAGLFALNASFGNTVMLGIPLITAAFGQAGLTILLAILALHSMVLLSVATVVAEIGLHSQAPLSRVLRATLLGVLRHPIVMAVFLAFVWHGLGIPVPAPMRRVLELLGGAGPPLALFCLGGSLAGFSLVGARAEVGFASFLKLVLMPALAWGACWALGLSPLETAVAVVTSALPTGANAFLLARRYETGVGASGATVLLSTLISIATLSALLAYFKA
jgi:predicted permease